jgi:hemerythrin-like metal-binding protein
MATATANEVFPWRAEYSVGIPLIDTQHRGLIKLINDLHASMLAGKGSQAMAGILDDLIRYTESHFSYEQAMLRQSGYSGLAAHIEEHQRLTKQVTDLRQDFATSKVCMTLGVMRFLKDWLANHILDRDMDYARELKTH